MRIIWPEDSICDIIEFEKYKPHIISFVGAGGKTTLIYRLSEELISRGLTVLITTTTKMYLPEEDYIEWQGAKTVRDIREYLKEHRAVTVARTSKENPEKITGIPEEDYGLLSGMADVLLVEADGAKRKPLKVPAEHEPVLFPGSDLVVGVLGMRSIGMTIAEASQRPEGVAAFLQTDVEHKVTREDLEQIAESPRGLKKGVDCRFLAVGNQYEPKVLRDFTK